jgi:hypothetical protein
VNFPDLLAAFAMAVSGVNGDGRIDVILAESDTVNALPGAIGSLSDEALISNRSSRHSFSGWRFVAGAPSGTQVSFAAPSATGS